ncbi:ArnT family glycosyltransferase [Lysinibacillus sp. UGB7]|uniref:ArnT family glycosyltransferase n=1 Tax=Lysinibacillus sp. UGB7 TaxID=3411039 RepID=UPI003B79B0CA
MKTKIIQQFPYILLFVLVALAFQVAVFDNIIIDVFSWHLIQPETIEGGSLLIIILLCYIFVNRFLNTSYNFVLVALITIIYLINTNLFFPILITIFYFEVIFSIGGYVNKRFYPNTNNDKLVVYLRNFLIGFTIWSVINLILALIGFGTINNIRITTLILFVLSLHRGVNKPFAFFLAESLNRFSKNEKDIISFIVVLVLALLSKSNRAIDYDSIWYGLRPEFVLVGENSFFDNLGLVQFVHYYPKLFEFFTLPLSNLGDYSFIYSINILFFILSLIVIFKISDNLIKKPLYSLIGTLMLATIPAFANISTTAKPDIFSIFFIILGVFHLMNFVYENKSKELIFGFSALVLSLGGKSTSFLYVPFLLFGFLIVVIIGIKKYDKQYFLLSNLYKAKSLYWLLIASLVSLLLICYRTFRLTGYPVYPSGIGLWNKLGFKAKYPVTAEHDVDGLVINFSLSEIMERWYKLLLDPKDYPHIIMLWTGNLLVFLAIVLVILVIFKRIKIVDKSSNLLVIFGLPVVLVGIFFATFMINAGDGNYFLIPIVLAFLGIYIFIRKNLVDSKLQKWINIGVLIFLPIQLILTFVSHSSWQWGTQQFTSNLEIYQKESNDLLFEAYGLNEIEEYIQKVPHNTRTVGFGDEQVLNYLSTRFEHITGIASDHLGNSSIVSSEQNFYEYLKWAKIDFIITPKEEVEDFESVKNVISMLEEVSNNKIESEKYKLLDIRTINWVGNTLDTTILREGWHEAEGDYRWINKNATSIFKSGNLGELLLEGIVPERYDEITLSINIDGERISEEVLKAGDFQIKKEIPKNKIIEIEINTDKSFVPKEDGNSNDIRELSIIVKRMETR